MGGAVGANELLGITTESHKLAAVVTEFEQKQHGTHKESLLAPIVQNSKHVEHARKQPMTGFSCLF
jgi:hypothetical protein